MKIDVVCIEERRSDSGQRAKLIIPLPPPLPTVDGYGNNVAHPPPPTADIRLFLTSPRRQELFGQIDPLERKAKILRPDHARDPEHRAELALEQSRLLREAAAIRERIASLGEFAFEHGARYRLTIEKIDDRADAGKKAAK